MPCPAAYPHHIREYTPGSQMHLSTQNIIIYGLGSAHEKNRRLNQCRSKVEIPHRARREERVTRSKLKQAFIIDSDANLFMYLMQCSRFGS